MQNKNKLIIGYGIVGKATAHTLDIKTWIDLDKECFEGNFATQRSATEKIEDSHFIFICLPTPTKKDSTQNLSVIHDWLKEIKTHGCLRYPYPIVIIRSTILPGTTNQLIKQYGLNIVHIPEFLTQVTAFADTKNPELFVVGTSDPLVREKIKNLFASSSMEAKNAIYCDPTTAETIKYAMNSFFALKVIFGNQLWDVCKQSGADYTAIKNALELHKWGSKNGWDVWHGGYRGFGGKCLSKDIKAFTVKFDLPLLKTIIKINDSLKTNP